METDKSTYLDLDVINNLKELGGEDGDAFFKEIIGLYNDQYPELFKNIKANAILKEPLKLSQAAHALKGASLNIGAKEIASICKDIELSGKNNDLNNISEKIYQLEAKYSETMKIISDLIK
jgi:HPt (histidine-containing phosphotransfer) domain-containing protein